MAPGLQPTEPGAGGMLHGDWGMGSKASSASTGQVQCGQVHLPAAFTPATQSTSKADMDGPLSNRGRR